MVDKKIQSIIISMKTLFLLYISVFFLISYESVVFVDPRWGQIFSIAVLFAVPYLILDYIIAILRFFNVIKDGKHGGILIFDLLIDHAPKFPTKGGFHPDWKGFPLQIVIGFLLFTYFWGQTTTAGEIFAGVPSMAPAQITPQDRAEKTGLVAPPEDVLSTTLTSIIALVAYLGLTRGFKVKDKNAVIIALLIGSFGSAVYMADLHQGVYKFDAAKIASMQKFFFIGNIVSSVTGAQYAFDVFHRSWNMNIVQAGLCIGC